MPSVITAGTASNTALNLTSDTSGELQLRTNNGATTAMTLTTGGDVGIGTTSPTSIANYKSLTVNGATSGLLSVQVNGTDSGYIYADSTSFNIDSKATTPNLLFRTNGSERMRITSSGNLLVGTTTEFARVVSRTTSNAAIPFWASSNYSGDLSQPGLRVDKFDNNTTTSQVFVNFSVNNNTTACGQINANGAGAAAFGSWSDSRLKENIVDLPSQLENICALRPVEFDYIESQGGGHQVGFIAQEMQEVYPDAVGVRQPDDMLTITGWSKTEARLVKAIQELKAELDEAKAEIQALKGAQ